MTENFLKPKEVAERLKVTTRTLSNWRKSGKLTAHKIGKSVRYKESEINSTFSTIKNPTPNG